MEPKEILQAWKSLYEKRYEYQQDMASNGIIAFAKKYLDKYEKQVSPEFSIRKNTEEIILTTLPFSYLLTSPEEYEALDIVDNIFIFQRGNKRVGFDATQFNLFIALTGIEIEQIDFQELDSKKNKGLTILEGIAIINKDKGYIASISMDKLKGVLKSNENTCTQ